MGLKSNTEQLRLEENQLREQVAALSITQKRHYYAQELQQIKDPDTYAALNWFFIAGLHHFYLGKWQRGLINLVLMFTGLLFFISGMFSLLGAVFILFIFIISFKLFKTLNGNELSFINALISFKSHLLISILINTTRWNC